MMKAMTEIEHQLPFDNSFATLPERFYSCQNPVAVTAPQLLAVNKSLVSELKLSPSFIETKEFANIFAGNLIVPCSKPLSMAYGGHQFGHWVPQLGDGRAHLLGEITNKNGVKLDVQLKGSGKTLFSRGGDGRAWLGPVLREFLVSEAMHQLGIPTTRALCAVATGELVYREAAFPGAILTRVANSHLRIGTFQYHFVRSDLEGLNHLLNYTIKRLYPHLTNIQNPALELLKTVVDRQALLIAKWMAVGFIHGVMNTDNMALSGETIDYGPCAFIDEYQSDKVFSSIDRGSRYAFNNQAKVAHWNLAQLANTLLPLIDSNNKQSVKLATVAINSFEDIFASYWEQALCAKFGISMPIEGDIAFCKRFLQLMENNQADFTLTFQQLTRSIDNQSEEEELYKFFQDKPTIKFWWGQWRNRIERGKFSPLDCKTLMKSANPVIIPRNHQIENFIQEALKDDLAHFHKLYSAIQQPFEEIPEFTEFQQPPKINERVQFTFCGT